MAQESGSSAQKTPLESALGLVTEVKNGEGPTALLLTLNVFLLLTAYYIIKPVREELILAMESGAEYKSYMSGAIAIALMFAVPAYARFAKKLPRNRLVVGVTLFFLSHLVLFYFAQASETIRPYLGLIFFLWIGVFNMMVVAQFWAFANDLYTEEQGKRLFALVGLGASVGAASGSWIAGKIREPIGVFQMLLVAAALLGLCAFLTQVVHVRESKSKSGSGDADSKDSKDSKGAKKEPERRGAFAMVFKHRYLLLIAIFSMIFSFVNSNGEYMYGKLLKDDAKAHVGEVSREEAEKWAATDVGEKAVKNAFEADQKKADGKFKGKKFEEVKGEVAQAALKDERYGAHINAGYNDLFLWVNIIGVLLQMLVVSRVVKYLGMSKAFLIFPVIALADASFIAIMPALMVVFVGKIAENSVDYSLNNTVRNALWLSTTREMKYIAKQAVDTFFVRLGDVSHGLLVLVAVAQLGMGVRFIAIANIVLVVGWIFVALKINQEREKSAPAGEQKA